MMRAALAILIPALVACGETSAAQSPSTGPNKMTTALDIKLVAEPGKLTLAERGAFKVGFEVVNRGSAAVDPQLHDAVLTANGARVYAWDLAIQNGPRSAAWTQLEPGKSIEMSWPLGDAMFEKPGHYELVLTLGAARSIAIVDVAP